MTYPPGHDSLAALWQSAPKPGVEPLLKDLERQNRLHSRLKRTIWAILCGITVLIAFEEATGRAGTHGFLSAGWILVLAIDAFWRRRTRCERVDALGLDTVSLLKVMIGRARKDLFLARCLYAGVPCGAVAGGLAMKLALVAGVVSAPSVDPRLELVQTGAAVVTLVVMIVAGFMLARARGRQVRELCEKLRLLESEL